MKWIALALILAGVGLVVRVIRADEASRFADGSFIAALAAGLTGVGLAVAGLVWLFVLFFMGS